MMISVFKLSPIPGQRMEVLKILHSMVAPTLAKPGCLECSVYEEYDFEHSIIYFERWDSETELHRHIQSNHYLRVLNAMDLSIKCPEISFYHAETTEDLGLIQTLRGNVTRL